MQLEMAELRGGCCQPDEVEHVGSASAHGSLLFVLARRCCESLETDEARTTLLG